MTLDKRTEAWTVRFSGEEVAQVEALRSLTGLKKADYLRMVALGDKLPAVVPATNLQLHEDLRRIGVNVNQIARHLNDGGKSALEEIVVEIVELQNFLTGASSALAREREAAEKGDVSPAGGR